MLSTHNNHCKYIATYDEIRSTYDRLIELMLGSKQTYIRSIEQNKILKANI